MFSVQACKGASDIHIELSMEAKLEGRNKYPAFRGVPVHMRLSAEAQYDALKQAICTQ